VLGQLATGGFTSCLSQRSTDQPIGTTIATTTQALLLSSGMLMYFGSREGMVPWFVSLDYDYDAAMHGVPSDW
jgi:hypothetical protein